MSRTSSTKRTRRRRPKNLLSAAQVAVLLGSTREAVLRRRRDGRLLGFASSGKHDTLFPPEQLPVLESLEPLFERFYGLDGFLYDLLSRQHDELAGGTGWEALEVGFTDEVYALANEAYELKYVGTRD